MNRDQSLLLPDSVKGRCISRLRDLQLEWAARDIVGLHSVPHERRRQAGSLLDHDRGWGLRYSAQGEVSGHNAGTLNRNYSRIGNGIRRDTR
jgi:hypothetical protein